MTTPPGGVLPAECNSSSPAMSTLPQCGAELDTTPKPDKCAGYENHPVAPPECHTARGKLAPVHHGVGIQQSYPLSRYGLDVNGDADLLNPSTWVPTTLQYLGAVLWQIGLTLYDAVLSLLDGAFSLDLLGKPEAMQQIKEGLTTFHETILGDTWTTAALAFAALWGLWYGLVRGKTIETLGGLCASVALMVLALAIITHPEATILRFAGIANTASMQVVSGISRGTLDEPEEGIVFAKRALFDSVIVRRWCKLQFNDVDYCLKQRKDDEKGSPRPRRNGEWSIADAWLQGEPNDNLRQTLYRKTLGEKDVDRPVAGAFDCRANDMMFVETDLPVTRGGDDPDGTIRQDDDFDGDHQSAVVEEAKRQTGKTERDQITLRELLKACETLNSQGGGGAPKGFDVVWTDPVKVKLQSKDGTIERLGLLVLTVVGLVGAIALVGYLAVRLLLARVLALIYLLLMPAMLLAAACGRAGRASCLACFQSAVREILTVFVFALALAAFIVQDNVTMSLELGDFGLLVQAVVCWGLFLMRDRWIGFLSLDQRPSEGGLGLFSAAGGGRGIGGALMNMHYGMQMARSAARTATAPGRAVVRGVRRAQLENGTAESAGIREQAREELALRAQRNAEVTHDDEQIEAARTVAQQQRRIQTRHGLLASLRDRPNAPQGRRKALNALERQIQASHPQVQAARTTLGKSSPAELGEREIDDWIERRRRDIDVRPPEAAENLRAAGIMADDYASASPTRQAHLRERSQRIMDRDRELMDRLGSGETRPGRPDQPPLSAVVRYRGRRDARWTGRRDDLARRSARARDDNRRDRRYERRRRRVGR